MDAHQRYPNEMSTESQRYLNGIPPRSQSESIIENRIQRWHEDMPDEHDHVCDETEWQKACGEQMQQHRKQLTKQITDEKELLRARKEVAAWQEKHLPHGIKAGVACEIETIRGQLAKSCAELSCLDAGEHITQYLVFSMVKCTDCCTISQKP